MTMIEDEFRPVGADSGSLERRWGGVVGASIVLGAISTLMAGGKPPVPDPTEAALLFWVGWGPLTALGLMGFLAWGEWKVTHSWEHSRRYAAAATATLLAALFVGFFLGGRVDDAALLAALHLPFAAWAAVGAARCLGEPDPAVQAYAFLVKSAETLLTAGILFASGAAFVGLTVGIFEVLGVEFAEEQLVLLIAWAAGAVPLLALGIAYDVTRSPAAQNWQSGLTRLMRTIAGLFLPLAVGVLLAYVLWFIPTNFAKPFEERDVLIVYNLTILAIMVLLTVAVSGPKEASPEGTRSWLAVGVITAGVLTLLLNAYALSAVAVRALDEGLTPNRLAVIGWNVVTLFILAGAGFLLWRARHDPAIITLRRAIGSLAPLAAAWGVALLLVLPFL